MENTKKLIQNLRMLFFALIVLDVAVAVVFFVWSGTPLGWVDFHLNETSDITMGRVLAVSQFLLMAGTFDVIIHRSCLVSNLHSEETQIPNMMILLFRVINLAFFGLAGFVLLYEYSIKALIAGSGAMGLGVAYVAKDYITEAVASIQIQSDRLFSIGDWISFGDGKNYYVVDIERRLVVLRDTDGYTIKYPSTKFISGGVLNYTREKIGCGRSVQIQIDVKHPMDRILSILDVAARYMIKTDTAKYFYDRYEVRAASVQMGSIGYQIKYFCDPSLSPDKSNSLVYKVAYHFLEMASVSLESSVSVTRLVDVVDQEHRLLGIRNQSVLQVLSLEEIHHLSKMVGLCEFHRGEVILRQGETGDSMFFIFEGSLDIQIADEHGNRRSVATLWPGDCVGEMSMLTGEPRSADVVALDDVLLLQVTKAELQPILESNHDLVDKLSRILAVRKTQNQKHLTGADAEAETVKETKTIAKRIISFFALGLRNNV